MAIVYWIRSTVGLQSIEDSGYIGVAENFNKRSRRHIKAATERSHQNKKLQDLLLSESYEISSVYSGTSAECYKHEKTLRPFLNIGLNIAIGGKGGRTRIGYTLSAEFRRKRSIYMLGNTIAAGNNKPKTEEHRTRISTSLKGRVISESARQKQSLAMKGRTLTEEHKKKIADAARGKKRGPYRKKPMDIQRKTVDG